MIKKLITVAASAGLLLASVTPIFAAGRISISNTGQGSNLDTRIDRVKTHVLGLANTYTLTHSVTANQNTGANLADNNTGDGLAAAGNVTGNHTSQVEANTVNVDIDASDNVTTDGTDEITVNTTGQDSTANAVVDSSKTVTVSVSNSGTVSNIFSSTANTGSNSASNNTGNGTAVGGEASVYTMITTKLNSVMYKVKM